MNGDATNVLTRAHTARLPRVNLPAVEKYGLIAAFLLAALLFFFNSDGGLDIAMGAALALVALSGAVMVLWPILDVPAAGEPLAQLIAFVGCDGSGKSTLTSDILAEVSTVGRVELCYLGLGSGAIGERIKRLPLIGPVVERKLARKASQTRTRGAKIPGLPTAIVVYLFSLMRLRRFRRMLAMRRAGVPVITDRYPQTEVAGFYDGPGLSAAKADNWLVAALARQERRMYRWMADYKPDVVIRLNVDLDTAYARKPDHKVELLREKVKVTPQLVFNGAPIVDLDARQPYETVRSAARKIVGAVLSKPNRAAA